MLRSWLGCKIAVWCPVLGRMLVEAVVVRSSLVCRGGQVDGASVPVLQRRGKAGVHGHFSLGRGGIILLCGAFHGHGGLCAASWVGRPLALPHLCVLVVFIVCWDGLPGQVVVLLKLDRFGCHMPRCSMCCFCILVMSV